MNRSFWSYGRAVLTAGCSIVSITLAHAEGDTIAPAGAMTLPANHAAIKSLEGLKGSATDNVGVTKATIYLQRSSDAKSWNGTAWVTEKFGLQASVTPAGGAEVQFGRTAELPKAGANADNQLTEGNYYSYAYIFDAAGRRGTTPGITFTVDRTPPPSPVVTVPTPDSTVSKLLPIRGTAIDNERGSGIERVTYLLRRLSDNKSWAGGEWVTATTYVNAIRSGNNPAWLEDGAPPAGDLLASGKYSVLAYSYDRAGNRSLEPGRCAFTIDRTPPTLAFDAPVPGSTVKGLPILRGPVLDNSKVVTRVIVSLRRAADNLYWDGTKWGTPPTNLEANIADGIYRYTSLPSGENLPDGYYTALAYAYDGAGNRTPEPARCNFRLDKTGPLVTVTEPANNAQLTALARVTGTATDDGTGVARVLVALSRNKAGGGVEYWAKRSGVFGWGESTGDLVPAVLTASNATSFAWSAVAYLPSGANLASGQYFAVGVADDKAGNRFQSAPNAFQITAPNVTDCVKVSSPANGATIAALNAVEGRAVDGQKVSKVLIALTRPKEGGTEVWGRRGDVLGWGTTEGVTLPAATLTTAGAVETNFRLGADLPSGTDLPPGKYGVSAQSFDSAGGVLTSATNSFAVGAAVTDSVKVGAPANGATITALTAVEGRAVDGQKVSKVLIALMRPAAGESTEVWGRRGDVLGWGSTDGVTLPAATLTTAGAVETNFRLGTDLPSGTSLPPGKYAVVAQSFDGAGGVLTSATNLFTVGAPANPYLGKYDITFSTPENAVAAAGSGTFVLTVDAEKHATGTFVIDALKGIEGNGTFRPDGVTEPVGVIHVNKTSAGDSFAGSYAGKQHRNGAEPSTDSTLTLTVSTEGAVALHVAFPNASTADFTGSANLTSGEFAASGLNSENKMIFYTGKFKRHTGVVTVAGSVGEGGALAATLTNDGDANGDTFAGDLDSLGTGPMRGAGNITDTGTNAGGPGDGHVVLNWTSQKQ